MLLGGVTTVVVRRDVAFDEASLPMGDKEVHWGGCM